MPSTYLSRAIADGHAVIDTSGPKSRITYDVVGRTEIYDDPEEKVRAEFWAELIYRYSYEPQRIGVEITVPDRTPKDSADLVVFNDDERKDPFAVIETKKDGITDTEFNQQPPFSALQAATASGPPSRERQAVGDYAVKTKQLLGI